VAGGVAIAQAPDSCLAPSMPWATIGRGNVDFTLPPEGIRAALISLCMVPGAARLFAVLLPHALAQA
jgi:chemotaxis response regulator CheB